MTKTKKLALAAPAEGLLSAELKSSSEHRRLRARLYLGRYQSDEVFAEIAQRMGHRSDKVLSHYAHYLGEAARVDFGGVDGK